MSMMMMDETSPVRPPEAASPSRRAAPLPMSDRHVRSEEANQVMGTYGTVRSSLKAGAKRIFSGRKTPRKAAAEYIDIVNTTLGRLPEASRSRDNDIKLALDALDALEVPAADTVTTKAKLAIMLIVGEWMRNGNANSIDGIDDPVNMSDPASHSEEILL